MSLIVPTHLVLLCGPWNQWIERGNLTRRQDRPSCINSMMTTLTTIHKDANGIKGGQSRSGAMGIRLVACPSVVETQRCRLGLSI